MTLVISRQNLPDPPSFPDNWHSILYIPIFILYWWRMNPPPFRSHAILKVSPPPVINSDWFLICVRITLSKIFFVLISKQWSTDFNLHEYLFFTPKILAKGFSALKDVCVLWTRIDLPLVCVQNLVLRSIIQSAVCTERNSTISVNCTSLLVDLALWLE